MIEGLGQYTIQTIELCNTPIISIHLGETQIWPSSGPSYYYVLAYKDRSFSYGTQLLANGNNYCTFNCYYEKRASSDNSLIDSSVVTATPSATYFTADANNRLSYNVNSYGTTTVSTGYKSVTLSYGGQTCDTSVYFQGNQDHYRSTITDIVPNTSSFTAKGGTTTYTGGDVTDYWTSGVQSGSSYKAQFSSYSAPNSQNSNFEGYIDYYDKEIMIPSLQTTQVYAGTYTFTTNTYGGETKSVTINQAANSIVSSYTIYKSYDYSGNEIIDVSIGGNEEIIKFKTMSLKHSVYSSDASSDTSTLVNTSTYTCGVQLYSGSDVSDVTISRYNYEYYELTIGTNTTGSSRIFGVKLFDSNNNEFHEIAFTQAAAQIDTYTLTTSVNSIQLQGESGTYQFTVTSTKNGSPYQPTVTFGTNNIGGSITSVSNGGSGSTYYVQFSYTSNATNSSRSATISVSQTGGQSKSISVSQAVGYTFQIQNNNYTRTIGYSGGTLGIYIESKYGANAQAIASYSTTQSWCTYSSYSTTGTTGLYVYYFNIDPNQNFSSRNVTISFTQSGSNKTTSVFVTQDAMTNAWTDASVHAMKDGWAIISFKTGEVPVGSTKYDTRGVALAHDSAITSNTTVNFNITVQRMKNLGNPSMGADSSLFSQISQTVSSDASINPTINGSTHIYYGAYIILPNVNFNNGWQASTGSTSLTPYPSQTVLNAKINYTSTS